MHSLLDKMTEVTYRGTNKETRRTGMIVVQVHTGTGSMAEAMEPDFAVAVDTMADAKELERFIYKSPHYANELGDLMVFTEEFKEVLTLDAAKELFTEECLEEEDYWR